MAGYRSKLSKRRSRNVWNKNAGKVHKRNKKRGVNTGRL